MLERLVRWSDSHGVTRRLRRRALAAPGISRAVSAADRRRLRRLEARGAADERAKSRWRAARPDTGLTWGEEVSGDAAAAAAERYGVFGPGRAILEIGPGYGRIVAAVLERGAEFERYVGVDLSPENVRHLSERFDDRRLRFVCAEAEAVELEGPFDAAISFLTFKHIYPTFEATLANVGRHLRPGGVVVFDLIEGGREYFQPDEVTFIREYGRAEAAELVAAAGLEVAGFDEVEHAPARKRLLVVARKPG